MDSMALSVQGMILLIVLNGIEMKHNIGKPFCFVSFNRTKWN